MTPRQLMALTRQREEFEGRSTGRRTAPKKESKVGSAGWLMMVSQGLERGRPPGSG